MAGGMCGRGYVRGSRSGGPVAQGHLKCCPGHQSWGVSGPEWPPTFWESQSQENRSAAEVVNDVLTELTQDEEVDNNGEEGNVEEPELGEDLVNEPNAGYELVEEDDSDYNSDYNSDAENENEIFALIAKY